MQTQRVFSAGVAIFASFALNHLTLSATDRSWIGPVNGDWNNPAHWNPPGVPGEGDLAVVGPGASITAAAPIQILTGFDWKGGTLAGVTMEIAPNGVMRLQGDDPKTSVACVWKNEGRIEATGAGNWVAAVTGNAQATRLENRMGAVVDWAGSGSFLVSNPGGYLESISLTNRGRVRVAGAASTREFKLVILNDGTWATETGEAVFDRGGSGSGRFETEAGAVVRFVAGTYQWNGLTFLGAGRVSLDGSVTWNGLCTGNGLEIGENAIVSGSAVIDGAATWRGGQLASADFRVLQGLRIAGPANKILINSRLSLGGASSWEDGGALIARFTAYSQQVLITNLPGGGMEAKSSAGIRLSNPGGYPVTAVFHNAGSFVQETGAETNRIEVIWREAGSTRIAAGSLELAVGSSGDGVFRIEPTGQLLLTGGSVNWSGVGFLGEGFARINGPVSAAATIQGNALALVAPGRLTGAVTVDGRFTWSGGTIAAADVTASQGVLIEGTADKQLSDARLSLGGSSRWSGSGPIVVAVSAYSQFSAITNLPGGEWTLATDAPLVIANPGGYPERHWIANVGTVRKTLGATEAQQSFATPWHNSGTVVVEAGALVLQRGTVASGRFESLAGARLTFDGGPLELAGAGFFGLGQTTIRRPVAVNGSALSENLTLESDGQLSGSLVIEGPLFWTGGRLANCTLDVSGGIRLAGDADKFLLNTTLTLSGSSHWAGLGRIVAQFTGYGQSVVVTNRPAGALQIETAAAMTISDPGGYPAPASYVNEGIVRKTGGDGVQPIDFSWLNPGTTSVDAGALELRAGGSGTGSFAVQTGGLLRLHGGTWSFDGAKFTGTGPSRITGGINLSGAVASENFGLTSGGQANGSLVVDGRFEWSGGRWVGGTLSVGSGGLHWSGDDEKQLLNATVENAGPGSWRGAGDVVAEFSGYAQKVRIQNAASGRLTVLGTGHLRIRNPGGYPQPADFENAGTLERDSDSAGVAFHWPFHNAGLVRVAAGQLELAAGGTSSGRFEVENTGALLLSAGAFQCNGARFLGIGVARVIGSINLSGQFQSENFGLESSGSAAGSFVVDGDFDWIGGTLRDGDIDLLGRSRLTSTADKVVSNARVRLAGEGSWDGMGRLVGRIAGFGQRALFEISGTLEVAPGASMVRDNPGGYSGPIEFRNQGTLTGTVTPGTNPFLVPIANDGVWETGAATWRGDGGVILGTNSLIRVTWMDRPAIVATGRLNLAGRIDAAVAPGAAITLGETVPVIRADSVAGIFANDSVTPAGTAYRFEVGYRPEAVEFTARAVPVEPISIESPSVDANGFACLVRGRTGLRYVIESSVDLTVWQEVARVTAQGNLTQVQHAIDPAVPLLFLRVRLEP